MYVKNYMTKDVVTIPFDATISDVLSVMNERGVHRIPVMKQDVMVGLITDGNIQKATPTKATSLSIFEINYLLAKTKVADYMTKHVYTIDSEALLESAVKLMRQHNISCLPVVDHGKLVGIITEDDVFDALLSLLGFMEDSMQIAITVDEDKIGVIADITKVIKDEAGNISHMAVYHNPNGTKDVVIRVKAVNGEKIHESLIQAGYQTRLIQE